ncbi:MAG: ATP-dependent metallopeptidase FtsH/Yme1/Tma family protein [Rhodospirillales bacterium]|nr:MAG: ATP-dependent metallopeptidase FtsH/Yme1/Tma family protein [Rhodospirillales bacterium]
MNVNKNLILWVFIALAVLFLFNMFQNTTPRTAHEPLAYSEFLTQVQSGDVREVTIKGNEIVGRFRDGRPLQTYTPNDPNLIPTLQEHGVRITAELASPGTPGLWGILISWFPMLLLIAVWIFFMRQMQAGGGKAMGFGKSKARLLTERSGRVTFDDVAGIDEAKQELEEIVDFLKDPQRFQRLGGKIPKGCLLVGPPGTGKTLLARAIAGEANVPFFTISGSDFVEMFVGVGASRVRDMFEQAKKNAPCIVFIDEIDAVGRHRGAGLGGGNDEREQTLNQLLVEMDGFEANEGVILIAATNRPDVLDPALLRPGRFDRQVVVPNPDVLGREQILKVHMKKVPLAPDVNARVIARGTPGFSGADLANLVNEAALLAARAGRRKVTMADFEAAKDKVMMGSERRSMVMTEDEKRLTAYHEAGHALVGLHVPKHDPLHKVTIIPRGRALGLTMSLPERDRYTYSRQELESRLAVMFGGRIAELVVFGEDNVTTGAGNDIKQATDMARRMVTEFGFSDRLGPLRYTDNQEEIFLGHSVTQQKHVSDATARLIDQEVRRLVDEAEQRALRILEEHRDELDKLANALLEYETLSGEEVAALLRGEDVLRPEPKEAPPASRRKQPRRRSSVPSSGKTGKPHGTGLEPEPQPGA